MADWAVLPAGSLSYRLCWEGPSSQPPLLLVVLVRQCSGMRWCECSGRETCSPYYTQCACWQARYYPVDLVEWVTCLTCLSRIHLHKKKKVLYLFRRHIEVKHLLQEKPDCHIPGKQQDFLEVFSIRALIKELNILRKTGLVEWSLKVIPGRDCNFKGVIASFFH